MNAAAARCGRVAMHPQHRVDLVEFERVERLKLRLERGHYTTRSRRFAPVCRDQ
jgi:anti-sigma28 factor (negative regulator of flagellin synthesis)